MNLKQYIHSNGLSIDDFAKSIGVHSFTVRRYLNKERRPRRDISLRIKKITNGQVTASDWEDDERILSSSTEMSKAI